MNPIEQLQITNGLVAIFDATLPDGWHHARVTFRAVSSYGELTVEYTDSPATDAAVTQLYPVPNDPIDPLYKLRDCMYTPSKGTWFTFTLMLAPDGRFETMYDFDSEPEFSADLAAGTWTAELEDYPRDLDATPAWLEQKVAAGN